MRRVPPPIDVTGVAIRPFDPAADEEPWLALNARVFVEHPEQAHWTGEDLRARIAQPWFDAGDFLVAERDGRLLGFNWVKIEERANEGRVGEIYVVGIAPEQRGRGMGAALLSHGLRRMAARGVDIAAIYVDETNTHAVKLYDSMGFHNHHVDVCYSRSLGAAEAAGEAAA
jgi:mycothiol synthase